MKLWEKYEMYLLEREVFEDHLRQEAREREKEKWQA